MTPRQLLVARGWLRVGPRTSSFKVASCDFDFRSPPRSAGSLRSVAVVTPPESSLPHHRWGGGVDGPEIGSGVTRRHKAQLAQSQACPSGRGHGVACVALLANSLNSLPKPGRLRKFVGARRLNWSVAGSALKHGSYVT